MCTPQVGPVMGTSEKTKPGQSSDKGKQHLADQSIRCCLLFWAFLRLVVSAVWTSIFVLNTWYVVSRYWYLEQEQVLEFLKLTLLEIFLQLVEFGMIVTFICAGVKKSASLYRAYYRYCILTLIIYIIAVILCFALDYESRRYIGDIYLTYHFNYFTIIENDAIVFGVAASLDICLEILLIFLIKRLINKYSSDEDITNCENV